jgi:hypothetical protein
MIYLHIIFFLILGLAIWWEFQDYHRIYNRPAILEIEDKKKRIKELKFYATYNSENNIIWRSQFIISYISMGLISYILKYKNIVIEPPIYFLMFMVIFLVQYFANNFKTFHLYRVMSSKVTAKPIL